MWTEENRRFHERRGPRYPSDLTDAEWALIAPFDPAGQARRSSAGGRRPRGDERRSLCAGDLWLLNNPSGPEIPGLTTRGQI